MHHKHSLLTVIAAMIIVAAMMVSCHSEPELQSRRTVLVYMIATNSLGTGGFNADDIEEMLQAARNGGLNGGRLLVYHTSYTQSPTLYEIKAESTGKAVLTKLKGYSQDVPSVAAERMAEVIADTKSIAPADDYGLVMWSHGSGWLQDGMEGLPSIRSFGQDINKTMNVTTLAEVLGNDSFSFIYFDCCYMGAVEVAYELRHAARYIVSSPSELPTPGMDYSVNVPCFFAQTPDLAQAAWNTYDFYNRQSNASMRTCTISVVDTRYMDDLADACREIMVKSTWPAVPDYNVQKYMSGTCYHYDLRDYMQSICTDDRALAAFDKVLADAIVFEAATERLWDRIEIKKHCGLSAYMIRKQSNLTAKNYNTLSWYADVVSHMVEKQ